MFITFKRLLKNSVYMFNNIANIFYFFGYMPYWIFTAKYIETQYRQSASVSSLVTGTVAVVFSAIGILFSGWFITKYKPSARKMAAWNTFVGILSVIGILSYTQLGCPDAEKSIIVDAPLVVGSSGHIQETCNSNCFCDYVKYSPVCGQNGNTYVSACHAGCTSQINENDTKVFSECSCIPSTNYTYQNPLFDRWLNSENYTKINGDESLSYGLALPGPCPVNCYTEFITFLSVMCLMKLIGSTGRSTNFLISIRCVDEKDKTVSMGFGLTMMSLLSFIPSPIFFGAILDQNCLVWGKTCSSNGNCWLYNGETLRWSLNTIAAAFIGVGAFFDVAVWYYVKNMKIYDDELPEGDTTEMKELNSSAIVKSETNNEKFQSDHK